MPRFVLLLHETPTGFKRPTHWDLMLESGEVLRTWALPQLPSDSGNLHAEQLADHRLMYLDFEGPIGGNRGEVRSVDKGTFTIVQETPVRLEIVLAGRQYRGRMVLLRSSPFESDWQLTYQRD